MITLTNLLYLLAAHPDYEQAACFARDFGLVPDPDARVLRDDADVYVYEVPLTKGNLLDDVAQVAIWRRLGIVVAWRRTESHPGCLVDEQRNPLRVTGGALVAASCAEANLATALVPEGLFALLRRPPDRNLPMLLADGKWTVYDTSGDVHRNALRCLKRLLWADVPPQKPPLIRLDLTRHETDLLQQGLDLVHRGMDERGGAEVDALNGKMLEKLDPGKPREESATKDEPLAVEPQPVGSAPEQHSPTPWHIGVGGLLENSVATAVFDANSIAILTDNGVPPADGLAPGADALHAVRAVNRMAKMDEAAVIQSIAEAARPLPRGAGYAALDLARALLSGDGDLGPVGLYRRSLEIVARTAHGAVCETRIGKSCSCHVGVVERALAAAEYVAKERAAEKPVEHVAVVRPDHPGAVHFVPPLTDARGDVIDRLDFEHRPDGTLRLTVMARRR